MGKNTLSAAEVWDIAVSRLKMESETLYNSYFVRLPALTLEGDLLSLGVSDFFLADVIRGYDDMLCKALANIYGNSYRYELIEGHELNPVAEFSAPVQSPAPAAVESGTAKKSSRLKPALYTFDNFITGYNNRHACAAAKSVAKIPGEIYNPLFLYGTNGVGKTHLLQAISHQIAIDHPKMTVNYVTCDEMLNDYYELLKQKRSIADFRAGLCNVDVLLIDDIHRLAKKPVLQEEFFNVFNILCRQNKQIVLTSDRQPCELSDIDKRLSSRFEQGMICQVGMPEYEEKVMILRMWREATLTRPPLSDEILDFLAENISSTVRRLKGSFLRLSAFAEMNGCELSIEEAENLLHAQLAQESLDRDISPENIQRTVANHFGITLADMIGKCRSRNVADPRMVAMYLCRKLTRLSSNEIGDVFGRTHANVLHAAKTITDRCNSDDQLRRSVNQLERQLQKH